MSECQRDPSVGIDWEGISKKENRVRLDLVSAAETYCFDLDGTLCSQEGPGTYQMARPFPAMILHLRRLKEQGHQIYIYTARAPSEGGDPTGTTIDQLRAWGVPYDRLYFGKPAADYYIDDKALHPRDLIGREAWEEVPR